MNEMRLLRAMSYGRIGGLAGGLAITIVAPLMRGWARHATERAPDMQAVYFE